MTGEQWDSIIRSNLDAFYNVLQPLIMPMVRRQGAGADRHDVVRFPASSAIAGR